MYVLDTSLINQVVLGVTAFVLLSGSAGLLLVSWSSPLLRGLLWVSASFLLGGTGTLLTALCAHSGRQVPPALIDLLMLGSFVFLDLAVRALDSEKVRLSKVSYLLLAAQVLICILFRPGASWDHFHSASTAVLLALQASASGFALLRQRRRTIPAPAILCASLLFGCALLPVVSVALTQSGALHSPSTRTAFHTGTSMILLAFLLGIAFGFFWMTTSVFANGLERMASTDPLTRIFNRRTFLLWCEKELNRSLASGGPFSLLLLDLDYFKRVNDLFGHSIGDKLLCSTVERVQDGIRGIDVLARWGGEEFAVLLPRASAEAALLVAERVRGNIERSTLPLSEAEARGQSRLLRVTASLGAATYGGPGDSLDAMFERADLALYSAKHEGRNRTVVSQRRPTTSTPEARAEDALPALLQENSSGAPELVV